MMIHAFIQDIYTSYLKLPHVKHFSNSILAPNEEEYPTWKKREKVLLTVEDWLTYVGLGKYISNFIDNGYDDLNFLGEDVITCKQDLVDIGISDEKDSSHLLESLKKKGNSAGMLQPQSRHIGFQFTLIATFNTIDHVTRTFQFRTSILPTCPQKGSMNGQSHSI